MGAKTSISWTEATWNPMRGCRRVGKDCVNCYAEEMAARFSAEGQPYHGIARQTLSGPRWTGEGAFVKAHLLDPVRWKRPRMIFVNSMSDIWYEGFSILDVAQVYAVMAIAQHHTFQLLTKRPERRNEAFQQGFYLEVCEAVQLVLGYIEDALGELPGGQEFKVPWPLPNVWEIVSCGDQETLEERMPEHLKARAAVHGLSYEPAIGPVKLAPFLAPDSICRPPQGEKAKVALKAVIRATGRLMGGRYLDWVIIGGESGSHARPFDVQWALNTVTECLIAGVPVFLKQLGSSPVLGDEETLEGWPKHVVRDVHAPKYLGGSGIKLNDAKGEDPEEWHEKLRVRQYPAHS